MVDDVKINKSWFDCIKYNRNTQRYSHAITLAKLIILQSSPDIRGGNDAVLAIMFDMNRLYERYVYKKLKLLEKDHVGGIISVQEKTPQPFWENNRLLADIIIQTSNANYVIDTKWKIPKGNKPSETDLRQMFAYNVHYDAALSILLYPETDHETNDKKPFRHESFKHHHCQIAFVNLFDDSGTLVKELGHKIYDDLLNKEIQQKSKINKR